MVNYEGIPRNRLRLAAGSAALGLTALLCAALLAPLAAADTSSGAIATGAGIFTEATMALMTGIMLIAAFGLQIGRNYFLRTLNKFTLRLGADIWWLAYIMIRDGLMFFGVLFGFELFFVGTFGDYPIAVPFMPLAIVLVAAALLLKLVRDADEEEKTNRIVTFLVAGAAALYVFGALFVTESIVGYGQAGYLTNPDGTIATAAGGSDVWTWIYNAFSSTVNAPLAIGTFYVCFGALSVMAFYALYHVTRPSKDAPVRRTPAGVEAKKPSPPATREAVVEAAGADATA
jgi:hypothetical protein